MNTLRNQTFLRTQGQRNRLSLLLSCTLALLSWSKPALAEPTRVTLHYHERPPYMSTNAHGELTGLVASPSLQALSSLGLTIRLRETPAARQLSELSHNASPHCALGWFRNAERETQFRFTLPFYQDQALIGLTRTAQVELQPVAKLQDVMQHPRLTVLVKQGYSYGAYIDSLISSSQQVLKVTAESDTMLTMVAAGRADYMLMAPEEYSSLLHQHPHQREQFNVVEFTDLQRGDTRHLVCNQATPAHWVARINEWVRSHLVIPPSAAAGFEKHLGGAA